VFQSATVKLTLLYLGLIFILSLIFSTALYRVSTAELDRNLHRQQALFDNAPFLNNIPFVDDFNNQRIDQIKESKNHILWNLYYINVFVLCIGGVISYFFARYTLKPIEAALDAQNTFTADASHELRTPLTAMKSEIEVALRDEKMSLLDAKKLLQSNLEEIDRLNALSNSLLQLAGNNTRLDPTTLQDCSVKEIIDRAIAHTKNAAGKKNVRIIVKNIEGSVEGDPWGLSDVVTTILDNAIKYSNSGTEVTVSSERDKHGVTLHITDHGIGIHATDIPHIFDRFYRADVSRSKSSVDGYGLGLAIAQKIIELHHGVIHVKSVPESGSTFTVRIPWKQPKGNFLPLSL
jgi:signal transduction histidine kinase